MRTGTIAVCSLALLCVASALPFEGDKWEHFKRTFGKSYSPSEEEYRQKVFLSNVQYIEKHNALFKKGEKTFDLAVNKFADMTNEEFRRLMNGYKMRQTRNPDVEVYEAPEGEQLPSSVDWRKKGAVTPVKNQAQCGSCWAFSTTGSLEGQWFLKKGKLVSLSEQNLMDCSYDEGNESCNGGLMDQGFEYIKQNKGIDTEASYPYEAEDDTCRFNKKNVGATLSSYTDVKANSESSLQSAIANVGPISVAIDAGEMSFQFYNSGVYYEEECSPYELDHGVLAVGYGTDKKNDYYIVKNSWGDDWGQEGYILMARNKQNNCGIATQASYPNV